MQTLTQEQLQEALIAKFGRDFFVRTTEEFNGTEGGLWLSAESDKPTMNGLPLFDYYSQDHSETSYVMGTNKAFVEWLEERGWYVEFYDAGTVMLWEE